MNSLTFRLLEVYQQVVESGSVTAASAALSLSQPTVSLQLKKLSTLVGMPLIEHVQGQVKMTEAGRAVYQCAQEVLSSQAKLASQVQALQGLEIGSLKIAVVTTAKYVIPPILGRFCEAHPNIDVRFTVGNREQIISRLSENRDDLYVFSQPPASDDLEVIPFLDNNLAVIAPSNYQGPNYCNLSDLKDQKFLLREQGSGTRRAIDQYCADHDLTLSPYMIIESNEAIRLAVESGLGLSILSQHTLQHSLDNGIQILNVSDFPLHTQWQAVFSRHRPQSLAAKAFIKALEEAGSVGA